MEHQNEHTYWNCDLARSWFSVVKNALKCVRRKSFILEDKMPQDGICNRWRNNHTLSRRECVLWRPIIIYGGSKLEELRGLSLARTCFNSAKFLNLTKTYRNMISHALLNYLRHIIWSNSLIYLLCRKMLQFWDGFSVGAFAPCHPSLDSLQWAECGS